MILPTAVVFLFSDHPITHVWLMVIMEMARGFANGDSGEVHACAANGAECSAISHQARLVIAIWNVYLWPGKPKKWQHRRITTRGRYSTERCGCGEGARGPAASAGVDASVSAFLRVPCQ